MDEPQYPITLPIDNAGDVHAYPILQNEQDMRTWVTEFGSAMTKGEVFVDAAGQRWTISANIDVSFVYHQLP